MSAQWQKKWRRKSEKEKNQIAVVVVMMIVAAYALLVFQFTYSENNDVLKMYNRQKDRLEKKRAKAPPKPPNVGGLARKLKSIDKQIEVALQSKEKLGGSFVSLNDAGEIRKLRFTISNLAKESGINIQRMVDAGLVRTANDSDAPSAKDIESVTDNPYGRPLLKVRAQASYSGLLDFFDNLSSLKYKVVVVRYGVFVRESKQNISADKMLMASKNQIQPLEVNLLLAL